MPETPSRPSKPRTNPAENSLAGFKAFCSLLTLEDGSPFAIESFQERMLADYFDGIRETLILISKKNGKSTLMAALALHHVMVTPDAECLIAAASRDQAQIILKQTQGFIRRATGLAEFLRVNQREVIHKQHGGRMRVIASDVDTADGVIPTLAIVDELHRHKTPDLYGVFRDGLGPRNGQMLTISTAGDDEQSALGLLRQHAYSLPGMVREDCYRYVRSEGFAMHEWALDPEDDRDDLALVLKANPASWQDDEALKARHDSPSMTPWQWARFACGVWLSGEDGAISEKEWRDCADPGLAIPAEAKGVYVGIDLAWKWDTAAFVPIWRPDGEEVVKVGKPTIIHPPGDGTSIDEEEFWETVTEMAGKWPEATFVLDPNAGGESLAQRIDTELHARVAVYNQQPQPMAMAAQRLSEAISAKRLAHPDDTELNAQVLAAVPKSVGEGFRFVKQKRKKLPIDAVIALAIAISALIGSEEEPTYSRATWGGESPASKAKKSDYIPCRSCGKPIHPDLHSGPEEGKCSKCRGPSKKAAW